MKSSKCFECGFVGWSDAEHCKACGASLAGRNFAPPEPLHAAPHESWSESGERQQKGLAIFALVLGILSFFTFGLLGVGAITGIVIAILAMNKVKSDPWRYGGRGMAIAGLVLNITSLFTAVPIGIIAAIVIPNVMAARMAANEASAVRSLRTLSAAEATYQSNRGRFATMEELAESHLIDPVLATGSKNGYRFTVELANEYPDRSGFEVVGVPVKYRSSGTRSFYVDESYVIRAGDNHGRPSTHLDEPLEAGDEYPREAVPRKYRRDARYD